MSEGEPLETFTIITTSPNELVRSVHDRMPVILAPDEGEIWLEGGGQDLLKPAPNDYLIKAAPQPNQLTEGCFDFMDNVSPI